MDYEQKYHLRPLWNSLLAIYNEFAKICDRNGLRYYGFAGTALGAVRHNGFIPWDDDLDVAMPRPDYEKFVGLAKKELPEHLKFVNWKNTPEFRQLFGKIQDSRREKVEEIEEGQGRMLSNGVYIDIFPIDGYPTSSLEKLWIIIRDAVLKPLERFHLDKYSHQSAKGKVLWLVGMAISPVFFWLRKQPQFMSIYERTLLKHPFDASEQVGDIGYWTNVLCHKSLPKDVWGTPVPHAFDGQTIMLPAKVVAHLVNNFGKDYMNMPPEAKRKPSHQYAWRCPWWLGPTKQS